MLVCFSLLHAEWRLGIGARSLEHILEIYFCLVQSLSLHTQLSVFLVDNVTLKTFKSVTRWIGSSYICCCGPLGAYLGPFVPP